MNRVRRDRLEIVYDILSSCIGGEKIAWLMIKTRIAHRPLKRYLALLIKNELIETKKANGEKIYITTPKGKTLSQKIYEIYGTSGLEFHSIVNKWRE